MSQGAPDIARIVSLIMENPKLIEEISRTVKGDPTPNEEKNEPPTVAEPKESESAPAVADVSEQRIRPGRSRGDLLCALKPYVSKERAQAIDSMLSIVEILEMMKGGK